MEKVNNKRRPNSKIVYSEREKKRRRMKLCETYNKTSVIVGDQFDRWRSLKREKGLRTDAATAEFLLDSMNAETNKGHSPSTKLQTIRGIPVNTPFIVRFYSSNLRKTSLSSVYILLEYSCLNMAPTMQPVVIDLGDTNSENMSDKNFRPDHDSNGTQTLVEIENFSKPNSSLTNNVNLDTHIPNANVHIKSEPVELTDTDEEAEFYQIKCEPPDSQVEDKVVDPVQVKYESDETMVTSIVDEDVEISLDSCCGSTFNRSGKNLNTGQIAPSIMPKKMVLFDGEAGDERRSSRLQSKGYRLDYSAFEEDLSEVEDEFDSGAMCAANSCNEDETLKMNMIGLKGGSLNESYDMDIDSDNNVLKNQIKNKPESDYDSDFEDNIISTIENSKKLYETDKGSSNSSPDASDKQDCDSVKKRLKAVLQKNRDKFYSAVQDRGIEKTAQKHLVCAICKTYKTVHQSSLENHIEIHLNGEFDCQQCEAKFTNDYELIKHKNIVHEEIDPYQCLLCFEKNGYFQSLQSHLRIVHCTKPLVCRYCHKAGTVTSCQNKADLNLHFEQSHQDKLIKCLKCDTYIQKHNFEDHKSNNCIRPEEASCEICGKVMNSSSLLSHVQEKHLNSRSYKCDQCDFLAKSDKRLKQHVMSKHRPKSGNESRSPSKRSCKTCDKQFQSRSGSSSHERRCHKGVAPYSCCGKPYFSITNLQRHRSSKHNGPKLFKCKVCPKQYAVQADLNMHNRRVHMERQYKCDKCDAEYAYQQAERLKKCEYCDYKCVQLAHLHSHMRTHMGETSDNYDMGAYAAAWSEQKTKSEKGECGELSEEDTTTKGPYTIPENTQRSNKQAADLLRAYLNVRGQDTNFEEFSKEQLADILSDFYMDVRTQSGGLYKAKTFEGFKYSLNRHLRMPPYERQLDIVTDITFKKANENFKAVLKAIRNAGKGVVSHYPIITEPDMKKLYFSKVMNPDTPTGLLNLVQMNIRLYFCIKSNDNIAHMTKDTFVVCQNEAGTRYVTRKVDETIQSNESDEKEIISAHMPQEKNDIRFCPVETFIRYISKLNPNCDRLWQYPKENLDHANHVWYRNRPMGRNTLANFMQCLSKKAGLSQIYTNYSIRLTGTSLQTSRNFSAMPVTSHTSTNHLLPRLTTETTSISSTESFGQGNVKREQEDFEL